MKNLKKDNKGFSLVELIVVVLIMAIIAVALAPQILKWVNNSRISADQNTMQTVIGDLQTALANEDVYAKVKAGSEITVTIGNTGVTAGLTVVGSKPGSSETDSAKWLSWKFTEVSGWSKTSDFKTKTSENTINIKVSTTGKVSGSMSANTDSIDN